MEYPLKTSTGATPDHAAYCIMSVVQEYPRFRMPCDQRVTHLTGRPQRQTHMIILAGALVVAAPQSRATRPLVRNDVVLVPSGCTDLSTTKRHPTVMV